MYKVSVTHGNKFREMFVRDLNRAKRVARRWDDKFDYVQLSGPYTPEMIKEEMHEDVRI